MSIIITVFKSWLPIAVAVTGVCGLIYATVQQSYRTGLDDPQIQMAEDAAEALKGGADASTLQGNIDIAKSLSPYLVIYDDNAKAVASSGKLNGEMPTPPQGVFDAAKANGQNRISWQPSEGVRSAIVVVHYSGDKSGFVLAGRNMREVEEQESKLLMMVGIGWLGILIAILFVQFLSELILKTTARAPEAKVKNTAK